VSWLLSRDPAAAEHQVGQHRRRAGAVGRVVAEPAGTRKVIARDCTPGIRSASRVSPLGKVCCR
jgi:hypothetical protein